MDNNIPIAINWLGNVIIPATAEKFISKEKFSEESEEVKFYGIWTYFTAWFLSGDGKVEEFIDESVDWKMYQNDLFQISYPMAWVHKDCSYHFDAVCLCPDYVDDCGVMSGGGSMPNTSIILSWSNYDMTGRVSDNSETFHTFENNQGEIRATISLSYDEYKEEFDKIIESFKFK